MVLLSICCALCHPSSRSAPLVFLKGYLILPLAPPIPFF
uniref:Uncharacterized protein n=1 Tax=Rhizophora mucronata TaxID=61149 RepID=A0A2P2QMN1_RHIMU